MFPVFAGNSASTGYNLTRSLRLRNSASAYLSRTPATTSNQKTWTWSNWLKRGALSTQQSIFDIASGSAGVPRGGFYFETDNTLNFLFNTSGSAFNVQLITTQVFRDPSAYYHIVFSVDTTQATAANRIKVYLNGTQITAFSTATYPAQNTDFPINSTALHNIGRLANNSSYFDGYLTEVNFIDGQALTPSSFGSTNALTGVWQPAAYTGSYGTNGFYLPFTDNSALTTSSNVGLGKDFSGNGNYWTTNNISITAGVTYDSMTDVPTLTSATAANFAVLNPLMAAAPALVDGNLNTPSLSAQTVYGTISAKSGKWYWEGKCTARATGTTYVGVENNTYFLSNQGWSTSVFAMQNNSQKYLAGTVTSYGSGFAAGDTIGVALDVTNDTLEFFVNGTSQGQITSVGMAQNNMRPMFQGNTATWQVNFGQRPFQYTPPIGFVALNTFNLPTSTIVKGNTVMDATLYTGTGANQNIVNTAAFRPDFVWLKSRNDTYWHFLLDSVRGATKTLESNLTSAEATYANNLTSFNSNGFSLGNQNDININGGSFVGWQWQAGQGTSSSNTNGSITSQVSVNASAGFSVVTYTGTGANATVGHGLGVAPQLIIAKVRSTTNNWVVYHQSLGNTNAMFLDLTNASTANILYWNNTSPTNSVFSIGSGTGTNQSSNTYVAYCWTPIEGYSSFGKYVGNGSTDGTFVYTGFRPKLIMIKASSSVTFGNWVIKDTTRNISNIADANLYANLNNAEDTISTVNIDILSNGFKLRGTYDGINGSGSSYIYMTFAENPFRNSLAR